MTRLGLILGALAAVLAAGWALVGRISRARADKREAASKGKFDTATEAARGRERTAAIEEAGHLARADGEAERRAETPPAVEDAHDVLREAERRFPPPGKVALVLAVSGALIVFQPQMRAENYKATPSGDDPQRHVTGRNGMQQDATQVSSRGACSARGNLTGLKAALERTETDEGTVGAASLTALEALLDEACRDLSSAEQETRDLREALGARGERVGAREVELAAANVRIKELEKELAKATRFSRFGWTLGGAGGLSPSFEGGGVDWQPEALLGGCWGFRLARQ